jgi:hypothetical protein
MANIHNMGRLDRGVRVIIGIGLLGLYGALASPWKYFTLIGLFLIATALTGTCPVYSLMGRRAVPSDKH